MDMFSMMNKFNVIGRYILVTVFVLNLLSVSHASQNIKDALQTLCTLSQQFLGVAAMVLVVLAGTIYAIGQLLGAETRARASVWATAMLTGAIIGILIYIVAPLMIKALVPSTTGTTFTDDPCDLGGTEATED